MSIASETRIDEPTSTTALISAATPNMNITPIPTDEVDIEIQGGSTESTVPPIDKCPSEGVFQFL